MLKTMMDLNVLLSLITVGVKEIYSYLLKHRNRVN